MRTIQHLNTQLRETAERGREMAERSREMADGLREKDERLRKLREELETQLQQKEVELQQRNADISKLQSQLQVCMIHVKHVQLYNIFSIYLCILFIINRLCRSH